MDDHFITIEENSEPCISKVHVGLRSVKPKAYEPVLVSIGPYHKANPNLQAMQQNKELYLNYLLERRNKSLEQRNKSLESREIYLARLSKFVSKARKCYVDPVNSNIDEFAKMMLLDGCFIVEFLRKQDHVVKFDKDDPIDRVPWMQNQILSDMMLLENQLPYFVLTEVYNMTKSEGEKSSVEEMVMSCFNTMLPRPRLSSNNAFGNNGEINHLLHLIHVSCRPFPEKTIKSNSGSAKNRGIEESSDDQIHCPLLPQNNDSGSEESSCDQTCDQTCCPLLRPYCGCDSDKNDEMKNQMGTVVELQEAGVKFKKFGKIYNGALMKEEEDDYVSLFDIDFKCGVMKVPCFKVDDNTETLLRNLVAYEQHFEQHFADVCPKYFTDFACLMNQLINSKEDAKVLRFEEIIMNLLGDDDELSILFNKLGDGVCESHEPYDGKVRLDVDNHCKEIGNTWMAYFNRQYFSNPWAGISTVAAAVLLVLALVQTVVAVLTLRAT